MIENFNEKRLIDWLKQMIRYFFLTFCSIVLLAGCSDETPQALFSFTKEVTLEIPAGLNTIDTHNFLERDITNEVQLILDQRNLTWDDISRVDPGDVTLTSFDVSNYRFIQAVSILISNPANPAVEKEMAFLEPVPINTKGDLHLFPTLVDLKEILSGRMYTLRTKIKLRSITPVFIEARLLIEFHVRG
jgi:hypothetical protein